jgi:hypothetical protein
MASHSSTWTNEEKERAWKWVQIRFLQFFTLLIWKTKGLDAMERAGGTLSRGELQLLDIAALESTLMSLRDIDDFFNTRARADDLRATDFGAFQDMGSYLQPSEREILNKALAHLTDFRISTKQKAVVPPPANELDVFDITARAVAMSAKFLDFLSITFATFHPHLTACVTETKNLLTLRLATWKRECGGRFVVNAGLLDA